MVKGIIVKVSCFLVGQLQQKGIKQKDIKIEQTRYKNGLERVDAQYSFTTLYFEGELLMRSLCVVWELGSISIIYAARRNKINY